MPAASLMFWGRLRYWVIAGIFSAVSVTSFHKTPLQLSLANQGPQVFHRLPRYRVGRENSPRWRPCWLAAPRLSGGVAAAGRIGSFEESKFVDASHDASSRSRESESHSSLESHPSRRQRRRKRAPPSELQQWLSKLGTLPGGLKLLLDLDNNADAVTQLEDADIENKFKSCSVRGFAGLDYLGPEPGWLPIHRCNIRTKNGADFVLAFWAGRLVEAALSDWAASKEEREKRRDKQSCPPMIVIISADAGMEVVAAEVRSQGLEAHVVKNVAELGTLLKALDLITEQLGPGITYLKPPLSGLDV